jgi:hypothetical protein
MNLFWGLFYPDRVTREMDWNQQDGKTLNYWTILILTLILLTWNIGWAPNNASRWQMGFNSAFRGLKTLIYMVVTGYGGTVVKVLCYKSEGRWFDSRWCHWNFSLTYSFRSHYGPEVDSASNRNEDQEHFLEVKVLKADNLNFLEHSGPIQACNGTALPFFKYTKVLNVLLYLIFCKEYFMLSYCLPNSW